jgi:ParB-like chromosome segregation protein Spo0J
MREAGSAMFALPLERILVDRNFNIRIFYGDIDQLAVQLMTEGQLEPIKVRQEGDQYFVVDGHRRQRAFARCRALRVERRGDKHVVLEGERPLRDAPGPLHRNFDAERVLCRVVDDSAAEAELFASQLSYNSGKPFTLLERMIFISRLSRQGAFTKDQLAVKTGFSRTYIANAQHLNAADPRLLDYVRDGRISQKLALRLLRTFPSDQQIAKVAAALTDAGRHSRDKVLPKDFDWGAKAAPAKPAEVGGSPVDPVRARMRHVVARLGEGARFAPNRAAHDRLETLLLIHRYATGKLSYARLEAHLLGRE